MSLTPCRHLDFETEQRGSRIAQKGPWPSVRFWRRVLSYWDTCSESGHSDRKRSDYFQACKQFGQIEGVVCCYQAPGPKECYEPGDGFD